MAIADAQARTASPLFAVRDLVDLVKPNITLMVAITTAGGAWLAPGELEWARTLITLAGVVMVVGAANTLNCYLERETDKYMARTKNRPLPAGRMAPRVALWFGLVLAALSVPALVLWVNPLTGLLAGVAFTSYVWVYTPLKQRTPQALLVGAVPGALPPLIGWTAVTGQADWPGIVLFAVLFLWQLPHFLAISVYRQREYARAGVKTFPDVYGLGFTRGQAIFWTALLLPVSLLLVPMGVAGWIYLAVATVLGIGFVAWAVAGLRAVAPAKWARSFFLYSLVYLPVLFAALMLDARHGG